MKRIFLLVCGFLFLALGSRAQGPSAFPYAKPVPNDTSTGTTQFTLTKINSSGNAVIMSSSDVNGFSGVCVSNCGTSGTAWIVFAGLVPLKVENTATASHYVTIGSTTGGDGHDTGSTSYPGSGAVVGRVQAGASSGNVAMVDIFGPEVIASSPAAPTITVANASSTGTTTSTLTKLTGAPSTAVIAATTDTKGIVGIVTSGAGTTGNAVIQIAGTVNCVFDGTTTADDYVQISSTTSGDCHDSGPNYPTGGQAIGRVLSTNGSAGTYSIVLFPAEIQAAASPAWNSNTNPTGNLSLAMGSNTSAFQTTTAVNNFFEWANTAAATSSVAQSSPILSLCGQAWEGGTPANTQDCIQLQTVLANGSNPIPTLTVTDSGSSTNSGFELLLPAAAIVKGTNSLTMSSGGASSYTSANGQGVIVGDASHNFFYGQRPGQSTTETIQLCDSAATVQCVIGATSLAATSAGITAGQTVQVDTSNANSLVVGATASGAGVVIGFAVNTTTTGQIVQLAIPGSVINTPILGTGTCATLGQFVIQDTTTAGRVKCTGTYTAGTVLGTVVTVQSTVGSAVGVLVWPR
jgi:hypothetical protein